MAKILLLVNKVFLLNAVLDAAFCSFFDSIF